jgi:hypothetical protein
VTAAPPSRVRWRERQTVRAADLAAEQDYRLDARRRHLRGRHLPGVAAGLGLEAGADGVTVAPGLAVDGRGRSIVLAHPQTLDPATLEDAFGRLGAGELVLSIRHARREVSRPRPGRTACGPGSNDRWIEECRLQLAIAAAFTVLPPHQPAGDDGGDDPPVPLGTVVRGVGGFSVRPGPRALAGLVAQSVVDPAGRARLELFEDPDRRRLTVAVGDGASPPAERLAVDRDLATRVRDDAVAGGRVELVEKGPRPSQRLRFGALAATPVEARPWSVYRTDFQPLDADGQPAGPVRRQLRVEIGPPGEDGEPAAYLFAAGRRAAGSFVPVLRLDSEGTLTVRALAVEGQVVEAPIPADPNDPRFAAAAGGAMLQGVGATLGQTAAVAVGVTVEATTIFEAEDLEFSVGVTNPGPARLQEVRIYTQLAPLAGSTVLATLPVLSPGAEESVDGSYPNLDAGTYTLAVSAVGTGPGSTPVAASELITITVNPVIE